ncbi:SWIM zinc finger domain protein [Halalkaliarchaeum desulfuricum]|uniref:SWIM zinc finger domain protein n=1 Tax=Halalkaliarchaeum desulfuricum TaxID=2055893 RepID=A0A343TNU8_9EURY|nr:SWIM zinc finger family protein [Halalkaliarchaeum desulfuricum]AUX10770.1 SWIM zinc finger domain protein [Halalkaliarchaeum desulfuricum]
MTTPETAESTETPETPETGETVSETATRTSGVSGRTHRALTEEMTVRPLRDGRYVVETDGGTYVVDIDDASCTCPDHAIRREYCKHLRRVAFEIAAESVPAPEERLGACAVCGRELFVPRCESGSYLCEEHRPAVGEVVRDRETGSLLVVVAVTTDRADAVETDEGRIVAEYPTNTGYGDHEPVVRAVYASGLAPDRDVGDLKPYSFPASRIVRLERSHRGPVVSVPENPKSHC